MAKKGTVILNLRIPSALADKLSLMAVQEHTTKSEIARKILEQGVQGDLHSQVDEILPIVKQALNEIISPAVDRLAALCAKGAITSAAAYFLSATALSAFVHPSMRPEFNVAITKAKKMGVSYTRIKDGSIDEFLENSVKNFNHTYLERED